MPIKQAILISLVFTAILVLLLVQWTNLPVVYQSWTTKQCVKVIDYGNQGYSCNNMPKKYQHYWSK